MNVVLREVQKAAMTKHREETSEAGAKLEALVATVRALRVVAGASFAIVVALVAHLVTKA